MAGSGNDHKTFVDGIPFAGLVNTRHFHGLLDSGFEQGGEFFHSMELRIQPFAHQCLVLKIDHQRHGLGVDLFPLGQ